MANNISHSIILMRTRYFFTPWSGPLSWGPQWLLFGIWLFRPFAGSPPFSFAPWLFRPPGSFAFWLIRPWLVRPSPSTFRSIGVCQAMRCYLRDNVVWRAAHRTYPQSGWTVKRMKKNYRSFNKLHHRHYWWQKWRLCASPKMKNTDQDAWL